MVSKNSMMARYRSILGLILAVVATFMVSCGSAAAATKSAPSYTAAQIEQIQQSLPGIQEQRDRINQLQTFIQQRRWVDVGTFIHGPLGDLRRNMNRLADNLAPKDKQAARQAAKDLFSDLVRIDQAAKEADYQQAVTNFRSVLQEFDTFLNLIPKA